MARLLVPFCVLPAKLAASDGKYKRYLVPRPDDQGQIADESSVVLVVLTGA